MARTFLQSQHPAILSSQEILSLRITLYVGQKRRFEIDIEMVTVFVDVRKYCYFMI